MAQSSEQESKEGVGKITWFVVSQDNPDSKGLCRLMTFTPSSAWGIFVVGGDIARLFSITIQDEEMSSKCHKEMTSQRKPLCHNTT